MNGSLEDWFWYQDVHRKSHRMWTWKPWIDDNSQFRAIFHTPSPGFLIDRNWS
jgi:hypothetical protein